MAEGFEVGLGEEQVEALALVGPLLAAGDAGEFGVPVELSLGFGPVLGDLGAGGFGCQAVDWLAGQGLIDCHEGWGGWDHAHGVDV